MASSPASCENFDRVPAGDHPAAWTDVSGQWQVATSGNDHVLEQQADPMKNARFATWTGSMSWQDLQISARVTWDQGECVLARFQSVDACYALCLDSDSGEPMGDGPMPPPTKWRLVRHGDGGPPSGMGATLAEGPIADPTQAQHTLTLMVNGPILTPMVDSMVEASVIDVAYPTGAIGLFSRAHGQFTQVCVVPQ
jgi:hypothetical protein